VSAVDSGGGATNIVIDNATIDHNGGPGVSASGNTTTVRMRNSTINRNAVGLSAVSGGKLVSFGGNLVANNTSNGAFTQTFPLQ
jgi:hypothetical protein